LKRCFSQSRGVLRSFSRQNVLKFSHATPTEPKSSDKKHDLPDNVVFNPVLLNRHDDIKDLGDLETHMGGTELAEAVDPHYWDELLPGIVDIEGSVGSSFLNPVVIPTFGDTERIIGCMGECWKADHIDFDHAEFQYWIMQEDSFGVCSDCGLHFFCASNESIQHLGLPVQGKMDGAAHKDMLSGREVPLTSEDFDLSRKYLSEKYELTDHIMNEMVQQAKGIMTPELTQTVESIQLELADIKQAKDFLLKLEKKETTPLTEHLKELDASEERKQKVLKDVNSLYVVEEMKEVKH